MAHETAQQRARRQKRDPLRAAQIAPSHPVASVVCVCGDRRLLHRLFGTNVTDSACTAQGCDCTEYREA